MDIETMEKWLTADAVDKQDFDDIRELCRLARLGQRNESRLAAARRVIGVMREALEYVKWCEEQGGPDDKPDGKIFVALKAADELDKEQSHETR